MTTTTIVTGGAGFIGSHLCERLLDIGHRVVNVDNFDGYYDADIKWANVEPASRHLDYHIAEVDVRDPVEVASVFERWKPDRVIHLAALAGVRASVLRARDYVNTNVIGTVNILDAARHIGKPRIVMASTSSVYGEGHATPFVETMNTDHPLAPYPASKKSAELMAFAYHKQFGLDVTVCRLFTVYGPRVRPDMMVYKAIDWLTAGVPVQIFDDPRLRRDWTFVDDAVDGLIAASELCRGFDTFNIGRGDPVDLVECIHILANVMGKEPKVRRLHTPDTEPVVTHADISKARRLLNYNPAVSLRDGLIATVDWYQSRSTRSDQEWTTRTRSR